MKIVTLYHNDDECKKWYNEYHRLEAKSLVSRSWHELKPVIVEFLMEERYKFRKNASWFILTQILFELCLKTKRLLIGHDLQLSELNEYLKTQSKESQNVYNQ